MELGDLSVDREEKQRACDAAINSRTLARSEQLQGFLRYICEMELGGRGAEITEYSIATVALNRRPDYAPGEDSSVRSRAHSLRRKLQEFYETESPDAEWRIELPKGSYRPLFVNRLKLLPAPAPVEIPIPLKRKVLSSSLRPFLLGVAVTGVVALAFTAVQARRGHADPVDPILRTAWGPTLGPESDVLITIDCPPVARIIPSQPGVAPQSKVYTLAPPLIAQWYGEQSPPNLRGPVFMFPTRGYMHFSDTLAAMQVTTLLTAAGASFQAIPDPTIRPMVIHERSLVLIGSPAHSPFMARLLNSTPFSIRFDPARNEEVVCDGPVGSAGLVYAAKRNPVTTRFTTVYGLITVLPSQPGRDRPERTVIFSGIMGSPGAQAAVEYFTSPEALRDLGGRFRREGHARFPAAYQVVVRCGVDSEVAMNAVYEAHRIMDHPPLIE